MKRISKLLVLFIAIVFAAFVKNSISVDAKVKTKTVSSVKELDAELENIKAEKIIFKTDKKVKLNISDSSSSNNKDLVIEAPNASIENKSVFNSIIVKSAKEYVENATGNSLVIKGGNISFCVSEAKTVEKLTVYSSKADISIDSDAIIKELVLNKKSAKVAVNAAAGSDASITIKKKAAITITGKLEESLIIRSDAKGSSVVTSVPVYLYANKKMNLTLKKGSGASTVVYGNKGVKVKIKNKSGKKPEIIISDQEIQSTDTETETGRKDSTPFVGKKTDIKKRVSPGSIYNVYEAPSNIVQFKGSDGSFLFAVEEDKKVTVYKVKDGEILKEKVELEKNHSKFGTVTCDENGYFYLITGENNESEVKTKENYSTETVFVSKFDSKGKHIKTVGYTGRTGEIQDDFNTRYPFSDGCSAVVMNGIIAVNYSRGMYNGHQSSNAFALKTADMSPIEFDTFYNSHSFGQRAISIPEQSTFVFESHGDAFPRADRIAIFKMFRGKMISYDDYELFHFWGPNCNENNTFASMGGIAELSYDRLVLAGASAVSMNNEAPDESREIFIQIFNPLKDLSSENSYYTKGTRSGYKETDEGEKYYTDQGVKWLTSYGKGLFVSNVQLAVSDDARIVILYELYKSDTETNASINYYNAEYQGVYYMILDANGEIIADSKLYDKKAMLNPYEMPVFVDGKVCWLENIYDENDRENEKNIDLYLYELDLGPASEDLAALYDDSDLKKVAAIDKESFPDEVFRDYVCTFADTDKDMMLNEHEIANISKIDFSGFKEMFGDDDCLIKNLKGLEYFTSLEYLDVSNNLLTELDVSRNSALTYLKCSDNQLNKLVIGKLSGLKTIICYNNELPDLDIKGATGLEYLDCGYNQMESLDVTENKELIHFECRNNKLLSLDVSKNSNLVFLNCEENQIPEIYLAGNLDLERVFCGLNRLSDIDVSQNKKLIEFNCWGNWDITELDVSQNKSLEMLICYCSGIKQIDVSNNKELINLNIGITPVSNVDLSNNPKLMFLGCGFNSVTKIDLSYTPLLRVLELSGNNLTNLDLSHSPDLEELYCDITGISSIDLSQNPELRVLKVGETKITELDLSKNKKLEKLYCEKNSITSLDLSPNPDLRVLSVGETKITELDLSKNKRLEELYCEKNSLTSLDLSKNPELRVLIICENQLTELDLSNNLNLEELDCKGNPIQTIDISKNKKLQKVTLQ